MKKIMPSTVLPICQNATIVAHLSRELSQTLKRFLLDRGARISTVLTSTHYRRSLLVQGGIEIPRKVSQNVSDSTRLLDGFMELVKTVYSEPTSPIILGSFLVDEIEIESLPSETHETKSLKTEKNHHSMSETCSVAKNIVSKRLIVEDKYLDITIIN